MELGSIKFDGRSACRFRFRPTRFFDIDDFENRLKTSGYTNVRSGHVYDVGHPHINLKRQMPPDDYDFLPPSSFQREYIPKWWDVYDKPGQLIEWKRRRYPSGHMVWVLLDKIHNLVYVDCEPTYY
jgi:hypothetical protein